jgi:hypothetical protein
MTAVKPSGPVRSSPLPIEAEVQQVIDAWDVLDFARAAAVQLEDFAILEVGNWVTSPVDFGGCIRDELLGQDGGGLRAPYRYAIRELVKSSAVRADARMMLVVLCRMACNQWFLKRAITMYSDASPKE